MGWAPLSPDQFEAHTVAAKDVQSGDMYGGLDKRVSWTTVNPKRTTLTMQSQNSSRRIYAAHGNDEAVKVYRRKK